MNLAAFSNSLAVEDLVSQRRAGGKDPLWTRSDFHHGLPAVRPVALHPAA